MIFLLLHAQFCENQNVQKTNQSFCVIAIRVNLFLKYIDNRIMYSKGAQQNR